MMPPPPEPPESLIVIDVLAERLDALGIGYFVGGSVASSLHGIFRATNDVDLVVDLPEDRVDALVAALAPDFYVDADMIREARQAGISFTSSTYPRWSKRTSFPESKRRSAGQNGHAAGWSGSGPTGRRAPFT